MFDLIHDSPADPLPTWGEALDAAFDADATFSRAYRAVRIAYEVDRSQSSRAAAVDAAREAYDAAQRLFDIAYGASLNPNDRD